jgi:hypothetical protein
MPERLGCCRVGQGVGDRHLGHAGQHHDVAGRCLGDLDPLEPAIDGQPGDLLRRGGAVQADPGDAVAEAGRAAADATDRQSPPVIVIIERGDQHLEGTVAAIDRAGDLLDDGVEERPQVGGERVGGAAGATLTGDGVDDREVEVGLVGGQFEEQVLGQ